MRTKIKYLDDETGLVECKTFRKKMSFDCFVIDETEVEVEVRRENAYKLRTYINDEKNCKKIDDFFVSLKKCLQKNGFTKIIFVIPEKLVAKEKMSSIKKLSLIRAEYMMTIDQKEVKEIDIKDEMSTKQKLKYKDQKEEKIAKSDDFSCHFYEFEDGIYLKDIETREKVRRHGIATRCLIDLMKEQKAEKYYLQVSSDNTAALKCYEKIGFKRTSSYLYYEV